MSKPISLFSGYAQRENRVTNYCLLILKLLYEENPKYLAQVLGALVGEDLASHVGVTFRQQVKREAAVPDGVIIQRPVTVYIETKNYDWFCDSQLARHLAALDREVPGYKVLLALSNFEAADTDRFVTIRQICEQKHRGTIVFRALAFEDLIAALDITGLPKNLSDVVSDLRAFLQEEDLLPSWREWLDVVNCAGLPEDVTEGNVYLCPAEGGAYTHSRSRYFGMYRNKRVERIAEIEAIVDVDLRAGIASLKWKNTVGSDAQFIGRAKQKAEQLRPNEGSVRVFLLGPLFETDFRKESPGGMQSSKRYFNIAALNAANAAELAELLKDRPWSDFATASS